jgi:transcriptional regulator of NAD metabolism
MCPFTVVVFASNLKHVGDVRQLEGKEIEIHGRIKEYDGRAEIILERFAQLSGEAANIPALPKGYDVESKGRYSAGTFSHPHAASKKRTKKQAPPIMTEEPEPE